jgi:aminoglycoside phosphotransferase
MVNLPPELEKIIGPVAWQQIGIGCSEAQTYRLIGAANFYLKIAPGSSKSLFLEKQKLDWLKGHLPVPEALYFGEDDEQSYLLLSEVLGRMACDPFFEDKLPLLVKLLAEGLKILHSLNITDCPFDQRLEVKLEEARQRVLAGHVDESDFDEERQGRTAAQLYQELLATRPAGEDLVFTHGDYCLPNILLDPLQKRINGFIDLSRAGVADRYQDLALAARSLSYNFGAEWVPKLFEEYGLGEVDYARIEFYKLLDEFF